MKIVTGAVVANFTFCLTLCVAVSLMSVPLAAFADKKLVIAHRGASGYLPEHTIAAKAMAYAMGADYIEQDLVMTKDDRIIVLHDHHLQTVTNVAEVYPKRARDDGKYYVLDFTLAEIQGLAVSERFSTKDGIRIPVFKDRFPLGKSRFRIHTFEEEIELIQGLNQSTGKQVGIYPEIKSPTFHSREGKNISLAVVKVLKAYGYTKKSDLVYLQCFNPAELKQIHDEVLPALGMDIKLVQLIADAEYFDWVKEKSGLKRIAQYADGIGPSMSLLVKASSGLGNVEATPLAKNAHEVGLEIHPYTFRTEADMIPTYAKDYNELLEIFLFQVGVDGVFTDFSDKTVQFLESRK